MDFQLTEEQTLIQDMAKSFAASELAPYSSKWDEEKFLDRNVFKRAAELGFLGIYTREEHGGTAMSRLDSALVFELPAIASPSRERGRMRRLSRPRLCAMAMIIS